MQGHGSRRPAPPGLPELRPLAHLVISSEVGWRKPARAFFAAVVGAAGVAPGEVLHVGDDPVNDVEGARRAGLKALLFGPRGRWPGGLVRLADLLSRFDGRG